MTVIGPVSSLASRWRTCYRECGVQLTYDAVLKLECSFKPKSDMLWVCSGWQNGTITLHVFQTEISFTFVRPLHKAD